MPLVIIGTGGFGREVLWAARDAAVGWYSQHEVPYSSPYNDMVFVDDDTELHGVDICGIPVVGLIEDIPQKTATGTPTYFVCGVGSPKLRKEFVSRVEKLPLQFRRFAIVRHESVKASGHIEVGEGTVLCAGSIITTQVKIGKHVNLNLDCTVGHDCVIEDYVNISPGVHISGYCNLKEGCDVGTGVNIIPHITIGEGSLVGAGACVTKDVPPNSLAVGVPAKVIKSW